MPSTLSVIFLRAKFEKLREKIDTHNQPTQYYDIYFKFLKSGPHLVIKIARNWANSEILLICFNEGFFHPQEDYSISISQIMLL